MRAMTPNPSTREDTMRDPAESYPTPKTDPKDVHLASLYETLSQVQSKLQGETDTFKLAAKAALAVEQYNGCSDVLVAHGEWDGAGLRRGQRFASAWLEFKQTGRWFVLDLATCSKPIALERTRYYSVAGIDEGTVRRYDPFWLTYNITTQHSYGPFEGHFKARPFAESDRDMLTRAPKLDR